MGRKLDLSGLSDFEAAHVLQVVQRDMRLRKKEEERLSEIRQELDEEGSRCLLLSRQHHFNLRCCIRCCAPFTFLINPKRRCSDCGYNVCRSCRVYSKTHQGWLCSSCQKKRLLKTQSLEWFYTNVKERFKRFGSAKVLKTLYKKHLTEHSTLSELTDGSGYEESICNEGSTCGSDSTFYRQSEEHTMAETLTVARRVAEEAIDEAISKAEIDSATFEKQNEAHYLREHRGELIEELTKTIVDKIVSRRKTLTKVKCEYNQDLTEAYYDHFVPPQQQGLWRSHSAFSLLDNDSHSVNSPPQTLKKEGPGTSMSAWRSVDRLDSSVLKSPDGNWIALQSGPLSRPSLLTKRKSLVYSALERESGAVSAYEAMDSDSDIRQEPDSSWGAVLKEIHRKMTQSHADPLDDLDIAYTGGRRGSRDSEGNYWKSNKALINRKVPAEIRKPSSSRRTSIIDVNFNVEGTAAAASAPEEGAVEAEERRVRRSRKKRRSKKEKTASRGQDHNTKYTSHNSSDAATPETLTSGATTPDLNSDLIGPSQINLELALKLQQLAGQASISDSSTREDNYYAQNNDGNYMEVDAEDKIDQSDDIEIDSEMKDRLWRKVAESRLLYLSSTDDDLDRAGQSEEEDAQMNKELKFKLRCLEQEVKSTQFSSTEDELDRVGIDEDTRQLGEREELAVKVCKLASQVNATQFSSTEDELDRMGLAEEAIDEAMLWKLQDEKKGVQVRDLASLVSICQFSSTEDELDRIGQEEVMDNNVNIAISLDRRESMGDLDVDMFELRQDERNYLEIPIAKFFEQQIELDMAKESVDLARRESIGDLDVNMFELKDDIGEKHAWDNSVEQETSKAGGANCAENVITTSIQEQEVTQKVDLEKIGQESDGTKHQEMSDSEEDEDEFNRIIDSMLMMTLEDMQGGGEQVGDKKGDGIDTELDITMERDGDKDVDKGIKCVKSEMDSSIDVVNETVMHSPMVDNTGGQTRDIVGPQVRNEDAKDQVCKSDEMVGKSNTEQDSDRGRGAQMMKADEEDSSNTDTVMGREEEQRGIAIDREGLLSPEDIQKRYSAVSLRSITTEVLKVLNATEQLLQGAQGDDQTKTSTPSLPQNTDHRKLDEQFSRLEENVYIAAGSVYGLEAELDDLEECARAISSSTPHSELSFLEEQVASAAAKVQQSELQISDISARIAALRNAGLNVDPQPSFTKTRSTPAKVSTLDFSRQQRRLLPAPPIRDDKET